MVLSSKVPVIILFTDRTSLHFHSRSYIISLSWICPSLTGALFDGCTGSLLTPPPPLTSYNSLVLPLCKARSLN